MVIFINLHLIVGADRLNGFYIYITDDFDGKHPQQGHLCFQDQRNGKPKTLQNIICNYPGRYVVIYNKRHKGKKAILELCEVEVYGKI
jgi:hypothetical protein